MLELTALESRKSLDWGDRRWRWRALVAEVVASAAPSALARGLGIARAAASRRRTRASSATPSCCSAPWPT